MSLIFSELLQQTLFFTFYSVTVISLVYSDIHKYTTRRDGDSQQSESLHYFRDSCPPFLASSDTKPEIFCKLLWVSLVS